MQQCVRPGDHVAEGAEIFFLQPALHCGKHAGNFATAAQDFFVIKVILRLHHPWHGYLAALQAFDVLRVFLRRYQFIVTSAHKLQQVVQKLADIRGADVMLQMKLAHAAAQIDPEILVIEDAEIPVHTFQQVKAVIVESSCVYLVAAHQFSQSLAHFRGRIDGISERQNFVRLGVAFADEAFNAVREDGSLTRTSASHYQHGAIHMFDGLPLAVVRIE